MSIKKLLLLLAGLTVVSYFIATGAVSADDHGDDFTSATSVTIGSITYGVLDLEDDKDYFKFTVTQTAVYVIYTRGIIDTYGRLYDSTYNRLGWDDDSGEENNFRIERKLSAGVYYVEVKGRRSSTIGNYELHIEGSGIAETPDLTISASLPKTNFNPNERVEVPVTVYRSGGDLTQGTYVTARLYWSQDSYWDGGDIQLWESSGSKPDYSNDYLNTHGSKTVTPAINIPDGSAGTYYIIAVVDPTDYHEESNEGNNESAYQVEVEMEGVCFEDVPSGHWKGEYYDNMYLDGNPSMIRDDGDGFLNFDWGEGSPSTSCGIGSDRFSVYWTRTLYFDSGTWRFTVTADDGVRLYIDGSLKLDKWIDQPPTTYTVEVDLTAGDHTIELEYYENGGGAVVKLNWTAPWISDGFDYPVGETGYVTEDHDGDGWYNAQDFGVPNPDFGNKLHLGEDWNGEGGGDTDCGEPVYAVSKGTIVYAEDAGSGWGNVIIIRHDLPDGTQVESLYGHLQSMTKTSGTVERREQIGTIGKDGWKSCHLHFEIRFSNCPSWGTPGPGYSYDTTGWTDPSDFINAHRPNVDNHPVSEFTADKIEGSCPLTVQFTDQSTGEITSWFWEFGDGETSTEQNPSHTYNSTDYFTVSLTVTAPGGSDTETKENYIHVAEIDKDKELAIYCMTLDMGSILSGGTGIVDHYDFGDFGTPGTMPYIYVQTATASDLAVDVYVKVTYPDGRSAWLYEEAGAVIYHNPTVTPNPEYSGQVFSEGTVLPIFTWWFNPAYKYLTNTETGGYELPDGTYTWDIYLLPAETSISSPDDVAANACASATASVTLTTDRP